ncbi:MAG: hypothetical protein E6833_21370, partial [Bradyrhizobium sp.]|nr:hypothetical protein [Bradyrhizobium sp.]
MKSQVLNVAVGVERERNVGRCGHQHGRDIRIEIAKRLFWSSERPHQRRCPPNHGALARQVSFQHSSSLHPQLSPFGQKTDDVP